MAALPSGASRSLRADEDGCSGEARRSSRGSLDILGSIGVRDSVDARAAIGARGAACAADSTTARGRPSIGVDTLGDWRWQTGAGGWAGGRAGGARGAGGADE